MRVATYEYRNEVMAGVVSGGRVHQIPGDADLLALIQSGPGELTAAAAGASGPGLDLAEVRLLPPIQPPTVRDFMAFETHVAGVARGFGDTVPPQWYEAPAFYFSNPYSMIGAHDDVPVPPGCQALDFELEVAAVISTEGRDLTPEQARAHILGYTILNDWSARDIQEREMRVKLGPAKGKDGAATLGPWLVTADELEPYRNAEGLLDLRLTVAVNGKVVGRDSLGSMAWTFEELASYASRGTIVRPGDVLGSGTCGTGCLAEMWGRNGTRTPPALVPGDLVTMTVEGIGTISNRVAPGTAPVTVPGARRRARSLAPPG